MPSENRFLVQIEHSVCWFCHKFLVHSSMIATLQFYNFLVVLAAIHSRFLQSFGTMTPIIIRVDLFLCHSKILSQRNLRPVEPNSVRSATPAVAVAVGVLTAAWSLFHFKNASSSASVNVAMPAFA